MLIATIFVLVVTGKLLKDSVKEVEKKEEIEIIRESGKVPYCRVRISYYKD